MKLYGSYESDTERQSPPAWGRGLKQRYKDWLPDLLPVAPRVGAWIETFTSKNCRSCVMVAPRVGAWIETDGELLPYQWHDKVAPRVGAWIETFLLDIYPLACRVAPRVGAWIETMLPPAPSQLGDVAPRVGAWIETEYTEHGKVTPLSPPAWGRGLKRGTFVRLEQNAKSPPAWGRGLKRLEPKRRERKFQVAPRVGAWIETCEVIQT